MAKALSVIFLLVLVGCGGSMPRGSVSSSACSSPGTYACQIEMYEKAGGP